MDPFAELAILREQIDARLRAAVAADGAAADPADRRVSGRSARGEVTVILDGHGFLRDMTYRDVAGCAPEELEEFTRAAMSAAQGELAGGAHDLAAASASLNDTSTIDALGRILKGVTG